MESGTLQPLADRLRAQMAQVVFGQDEIITQILACLLSRGHALLQGVPGLAKTLLAKALARAVGGSFRRIQFTPDLMPSDVTGVSILKQPEGVFVFRPGPIFCHVLLADEINRTPPKTQSALLQAMEERFVTIDGEDRTLPAPFFVMATQNPIEYEGTYPLPEAQLDRFLMKIIIGYPDEAHELDILRQGINLHSKVASLATATTVEELMAAAAIVDRVTVEEALLRYVLSLVRRTRETPQVLLGGSPRAALALLSTAKAVAAMEGRSYLVPDDVKLVAPPVLRHRLILRPEAELEGLSADRLITQLLSGVPVPR
ncbi:MAG TPA: MoxR family ATPase [Candidatus Xenobia bacterium]